jgi:tripartite-type tricarboxylate transporter receptor subunit TctC
MPTRTRLAARPSRRRLLQTLGAAALLATPGLALRAQGAETLRLLVGFPPGGGTDAIARLLAEHLREAMRIPVVVENKAGAGGQIAAQELKAAAPDGRTLFLSHDHTVSILPLTMRNPGFDPARDFVPVAGFATFANALALSGGTPATSVAEYVAWVSGAQGGKSAVGVPAPASVPEFLVQEMARRFGLDLVAAPYRGSAPLMTDMLGNQVAAGVASIPDFMENHRAGRLRVVAVMGRSRQPALPDVPTLTEAGLPGFEELPFYGLFAPAGTPGAVLERTGQALAGVLEIPQVRQRLTAMGLDVGFMPQAQLAERERAYTAVWTRIIQTSGFQPR